MKSRAEKCGEYRKSRAEKCRDRRKSRAKKCYNKEKTFCLGGGILERELMKSLVKWKSAPRRKPLILKGARQVGKTWLMKEFGRRYFQNVVYINFDNNPRMQQIFEQDYDIRRILLAFQVETGESIRPQETLIILDEVQEAPQAISALKYFCENAPEYPVIAAGSLLGIALHKGISFPVGKVTTMQLYPLSFYEFLRAVHEERLADLLDQRDPAMLKVFHDRFVTWLKNYYYIGGMPEAVAAFVETSDYSAVRQIQNDLITLYEADFSKHIITAEIPRVRMVWNAIPLQLAKENKKFFFGQVKKGARSKDFEIAIEWLVDCGLIAKVNRVSKPAMPLKAYAEQNAYKLFFLDVGLLAAISELDVRSLLDGNDIFVEFKGALTEQYVCQQLLSETSYNPYYFTSPSNRYEINFMIQKGREVIPLEVKAEQNLQSKSLKAYVEKYHPAKTIRFSMSDYQEQEWVTNIPLFAIRWIT